VSGRPARRGGATEPVRLRPANDAVGSVMPLCRRRLHGRTPCL
jgi:hypothetical protein